MSFCFFVCLYLSKSGKEKKKKKKYNNNNKNRKEKKNTNSERDVGNKFNRENKNFLQIKKYYK